MNFLSCSYEQQQQFRRQKVTFHHLRRRLTCASSNENTSNSNNDAAVDVKISGSPSSSEKNTRAELPRSTKDQVVLALTCVKKAIASGKLNLEVSFDIPLIGATDLDDWPGGIRQQYQAVYPMVEQLMLRIPEKEPKIRKRVIDEADAVVTISAGDDQCMTFPTAETLGDLKSITKGAKRANIIINPQWSLDGNIINDFGLGPWRERNEKFVKQFEIAYSLKEQRIQGETIRILKIFGDSWQVFVLNQQTGEIEALEPFAKKPLYQTLEQLLQSREGSIASMNWVQRAQSEMSFNAESLMRKPNNTQE